MTHARQSWPDSGLDPHAKVYQLFKVVQFSLIESGWAREATCTAEWMPLAFESGCAWYLVVADGLGRMVQNLLSRSRGFGFGVQG